MNLPTALSTEIVILLGAFCLIIAYQMLTGRINTRGMLSDKKTGGLSPGRIQVLVFTVGFALYFVSQLSENPSRLPEVPEEILLLLFGSNAGYLGFKGKSVLLQPQTNTPEKRRDGQ